MGYANKNFQEEEWDAWSHFNDEDNFEPIKSKSKKVKKMKIDRPDKKRK